MGEVVRLVSQTQAEEAWERYRAHAAQAMQNPRLEIDPEWMKQKRRLCRAWERLFDRLDERV